jgi:glycosyltransferase involved in cell wall biosynthesis
MRIGIDARMYGPKVGGGGLGRYVEQLVSKLQEIDQENRYILFLKNENFDLCKITNPNFEKRLADIHWYTFVEQIKLALIINREKLDLVHFPHWNIPLVIRAPFVVTIHDLILLDDPDSARATTLGPVRYGLKRLAYRAVLRNAISRSKKIVAVSRATEFSILKHFPKVDLRKIEVVYEGVTGLGVGGWGLGKEEFILNVGNSYPHKNLKTLIDAFEIFSRKNSEARLVLAGRKDLFSDKLEKYAAGIDRIEFIREPSDEKLAELYASAKMFVFPTRLEGFGLPGLEAMSVGTPVIAARTSSLPEIYGKAAEYFDPNSAIELSETIEKLWNNEARQKELIEKGFEQIKKYSWKKMAEEIKEIYLL